MSRNIAAILRTVELAKAQRTARRHTPAKVAPAPAPVLDEHDEIMAFQREIDRLDNDNFIPDPMGRSSFEPKSIYSPVPAARLTFERPLKRKIGERNDWNCELPADPRRKRTMTLIDDNGVARGVIGINPFSKRVAFAGFGMTQRAPVRKPKPKSTP
jgi:hypothetical protein